jgi:hypothetical protein
MSDPTRRWQDALAAHPVNPMRARVYGWLMDAQDTIAQAAYARGMSDARVQAALDAVDERMSADERREDLYLSALGYYVEALGGRLEVRAVFGGEVIGLERVPDA